MSRHVSSFLSVVAPDNISPLSGCKADSPPMSSPMRGREQKLRHWAEVEGTMKKGEESGGIEGPDSMYVKLIASDGQEFVIKREHALISPVIEAMLKGPGQPEENEANEVRFREIPSHILAKVCEYFAYKARYANSTQIPEFPIERVIALELLMAASFLQC